MSTHIEIYTAPPSALRYMLRGFRPSSGWHADRGFPDLQMTWRGFRIEAGAMDRLRDLAGHEYVASEDSIFLLVPHVIGFRLLMAMLTHPAWPLPIWRALQVRNRLLLHRPLRADDTFDLTAGVDGWRVLEKGLEVDLHTRLQRDAICVWESVVTFYYRGRFGPATEHGAALGAAPIATVVEDLAMKTAQWRIDGDSRWQFGALTGDYNGIHLWDWYARRFGFPAAFAHSQRVTAQCLAHVPSPGPAPQQLDLWIKGPVFFGSEVTLRQSPRADGVGNDFALWVAGDARPALLGTWQRKIDSDGSMDEEAVSAQTHI